MQPKEQYELYKIFCDLMRYDDKPFDLKKVESNDYCDDELFLINMMKMMEDALFMILEKGMK